MKNQKVKANTLFNYTAKSVYSLLHEGINTMLSGDASTMTSSIPASIRKSCLVQGFNMLLPHPTEIKSRLGIQSMPKKCAPPYLLRGVGIGLQGYPEMSCGQIHVNKDLKIKTYPATCKIFVQ